MPVSDEAFRWPKTWPQTIYDDLTKIEVIEQHLAVTLLGPLRVTQAFLPLLRRSTGAIINNCRWRRSSRCRSSPAIPYSKAAASNLTQSLRAFLASHGVTVHAVFLGPVDTDMNRGMDIPKAPPEIAARGIFDALQRGDEDIFPDPAFHPMAEPWRNGVVKGLEREFAPFVPAGVAA